jgi:mono/diheme cytochrome c family protein
MIGQLLSWLLAAGLAGAGASTEPARVGFDDTVKPFLASNCYLCHGARLKNADVDLQAFETAEAIVEDPEVWEKAIVKMRTRQMPPPPMMPPDEAEVAAVTGWLESEIERAERLRPPDPGRVTARRLNRTEYNNTIRDLLGVSLRPADDFPQDDTGYGFDNVADVLSLSPVLMEKYMAAAERVARTAVFGPGEVKPTMVRLQPPLSRIDPSTKPLFAYDLTGLSLPNAMHVTHRFPFDGEYLFRVVLAGVRPAGSEPAAIALWVDGQRVEMLTLDPDGAGSFYDDRQDFSGKTREFRARVTAGEHWVAATVERLYEGLPASYGGPNPSKRPPPPPPEFKPRPGLTPERLAEARKRFEERLKDLAPVNEARVRHFEITGPFEPARGPSRASLTRLYACGHLVGGHQAGCLRRNIASLARRAYRRPVTAAETAPLVRLASEARAQGDSFEEAMSLAVQALLVSPDFLFRIERDPRTAGASRALASHELATRLSYFLWASMPDEALRRAADDGSLRRPGVLAAQVRRMLADEKASALVEAFGGQWLQFRALESVAPDRERFPAFDNHLRLAMRRETELLFDSIVRENRSVLDLLDAPYSFLNERLARHYGIAGVKGQEFRKVYLPVAGNRGGVLTHASVLTVSSYANRTSPVLRGKWILENLLAAPPPDPPAGTPRLDEAKVGTGMSLRQQMEAHRTNATCAACHQRMDPLGFGLENYDAIGAWRTADGEFPIDPSGKLPDGRTFDDPREMKAILKGDRDAFALAIAEKMLTYALGRGLERYDRRTVKAIARRLAERDYRFQALVEEIVQSTPFLMRKCDPLRCAPTVAQGGPSE